MKEHARNSVRTAAFWFRKAVRARASAEMYTEYKDAFENIAELYEQMAVRTAELESGNDAFELDAGFTRDVAARR